MENTLHKKGMFDSLRSNSVKKANNRYGSTMKTVKFTSMPISPARQLGHNRLYDDLSDFKVSFQDATLHGIRTSGFNTTKFS